MTTTPTLREAAQQALEALAPLANATTPAEREALTDADAQAADAASCDLRAALAEQAAEQAEPVAWRYRYSAKARWNYADGPANDPAVQEEPLYAAPPAPARQEPLTYEQMLELVLPLTHDAPTLYLAMCYESGPHSITKLRSAAIALIRAIERAHGITAAPAEGGA